MISPIIAIVCFVSFAYSLTCTSEADKGGSSFILYEFDTKSDCENDKNCKTKFKLGRGCVDSGGSTYLVSSCSSTGVVAVESEGCSSSCSGCTKYTEYGLCEQVGTTFFKSTGCSIGDAGADLILYGGIIIAFGLLFCICCCWICIPVGVILLMIGICVGCC